MNLLETLAKIDLFTHLDADGLARLASLSNTRRYHHEEWIVHQGDVWPRLFIILDGKVTAVKESPEGRSLMLTTLNTGEVFWGLAFFLEEAPMPAALVAAGETSLALWSRQSLLPYLLKDGRMSWELSRLMIRRVQFASEIVEKLAFQPVAGRLARLLLEQSLDSGIGRVSRTLTLDEMAARIGSTREMVCRFLHRFADQGLIDITRTEFSVTDRQSLQELARQVKG